MTKADEKWDEIGDNPLVIISEVNTMLSDATDKWSEEATDFLDDEDVKEVLRIVAQIMSAQMPEQAKVAPICARLEAYAIKFRMRYTAYMSFHKGTTEANMKKNHYKELYTGIDRLVDALKYLVK